jgi:Tfp pilus assembly PilM family ATPase
VLLARSKGWIGIDLGTSAVKLAQVEQIAGQYRLACARVVRRPAPAEGDGSAGAAAPWWAEVFRRASLRHGFVGRRAACVLSASETDLRAMNLPEGSDAERRAMIANELDTIFAGDAGRRAFDFWDTRRQGAAGDSALENVNALSVAEDDAVSMVANLTRSGFFCEVLDGLPLVLARAIGMASAPAPGVPVAALDWGSTIATFAIVCDELPVFTRHLRDCGYSTLPASVTEGLGLPVEDAERLLATHGLCDPAKPDDPLRDVQEVLTDVTAEALGKMVSRLDKTLAYPELHRSRLLPERIWLFGGGATVRNLPAVLSARIGLPVEAWRLPWGDSPAVTGSLPPMEILGTAAALSALAWLP